jgi:hypothetical protein
VRSPRRPRRRRRRRACACASRRRALPRQRGQLVLARRLLLRVLEPGRVAPRAVVERLAQQDLHLGELGGVGGRSTRPSVASRSCPFGTRLSTLTAAGRPRASRSTRPPSSS